jgi:hypothetical protein
MNSSLHAADTTHAENRAAYRAAADERTPAALDAAVLEAARAGLGSSRSWRDAWFRPLAFAAMFVLSMTLLQQFDDAGILSVPGGTIDIDGTVNDATPVSADYFEEASRATAEQIRQLEDAAGQATPEPSPPAVADAVVPVAITKSGSLLPAADRCNDEQRSETARWWRCIEELEKRGLTEAAELELQALLEAFPAFAPPE